MTALNIPPHRRKAKQTNYWVRNGPFFVPDATFHAFMASEANALCRWRGKSWSFFTPLASIPVGAVASRPRWRFAFRSSSHAKYIWARFVMAQIGKSGDPYGQFSLGDNPNPALAAPICTGIYHWGGLTGGGQGLGQGFAVGNDGVATVAITPDTDYYVMISDEGESRIVACSIYELAAESDTANGYLAGGHVAGAPILDAHRGDVVSMLRTAWKVNAAPLISWASNTDATSPTRTSATVANLITPTVTGAPTAASPGFTLSLARKSTVRRSPNVPCVMKAYGKCAGAGTGHVYLTDSTGTDVADVTINSSTEQWFSTTFNLPSTDGKFDLRFKSDGANLLTVRAASVYQYEA